MQFDYIMNSFLKMRILIENETEMRTENEIYFENVTDSHKNIYYLKRKYLHKRHNIMMSRSISNQK